METETKIIENTLRWITWAIDAIRTGNIDYLFCAGQRQGAIYSLASISDTVDHPASYLFRCIGSGNTTFGWDDKDSEKWKIVNDMMNQVLSLAWKGKSTDVKTTIACEYFQLELINVRTSVLEEHIKQLREVQKILFSTRDKKLEESIKYIDQMYDENDNSFEERLAARPKIDFRYGGGAKIEAKKTDHSIEISHENAIDSAFRILTLKLHPDKGGDAEHFKMLQEMRDHLLYVDVDDRELVTISNRTVSISILRVNVEQDFQAVRKLLQGKPIPKSWAWNEKSIKKMADDGVDTIALFEEGGIIGAIDVARRGSKTPKPSKQKTTKEKETLEFCIQCGTELKPETKFCGSCGTRVS